MGCELVIGVQVVCDKCSEELDMAYSLDIFRIGGGKRRGLDFLGDVRGKVASAAERDGWSVRGGMVLCPACRSEQGGAGRLQAFEPDARSVLHDFAHLLTSRRGRSGS